MSTQEVDRDNIKIQTRVSRQIASDLKVYAAKQGVSTSKLLSRILSLYWTNKIKKGGGI